MSPITEFYLYVMYRFLEDIFSSVCWHLLSSLHLPVELNFNEEPGQWAINEFSSCKMVML